jgi:hypothetical protein
MFAYKFLAMLGYTNDISVKCKITSELHYSIDLNYQYGTHHAVLSLSLSLSLSLYLYSTLSLSLSPSLSLSLSTLHSPLSLSLSLSIKFAVFTI